MKKEYEEALRNIEVTVANVPLTRDQHLILARNIDLLRKKCEDKPKKKVKDGNA